MQALGQNPIGGADLLRGAFTVQAEGCVVIWFGISQGRRLIHPSQADNLCVTKQGLGCINYLIHMSIYFTKFSRRAAAFLLLTSMALPLLAADKPKGFTLEKGDDAYTIKYKGELFTKYVIKSESNKPYLWPVIGPTGKPVTRAYPMETIDGEQHDHPHHRSIWFGHEDVSGVETWHEQRTFDESKSASMKERAKRLGQTKHREFKKVEVKNDQVLLVTADDYYDVNGKKFMEDERRYAFQINGDQRVIDCDITFKAVGEPVIFNDAKDAGFSVRVPTLMAVDSKMGGHILTSEGKTDKDAWGTRAKWCSYYGPLDGEMVGITMFNHPSSFRYPTPWHVRTYGLLTANPFGTKNLDKTAEDGTTTLKPGDKLVLRHRIILHKGDPKAADIEAAYKAYANEKK